MNSPQDEINALTAQLASLTARVYRLEQKGAVAPETRREAIAQPQTVAATPQSPATEPLVSAHPANQPFSAQPVERPFLTIHPPQQPPSAPRARIADDANLEKKIGQYWLNRIGIVAILIGVSYFLKYAFENNWIGPAGRIVIGLLAGIGLVIWSEWFRSRGYKAFSYSLKGAGIGTLYLSLWGAFQVYQVIPGGVAFAAMALVTAATIFLALTQDAEVLAFFALLGGFATPVLLSTGENHEAVLFAYVALLDVAILALATVKPWRRLLWGNFAGTAILYIGWAMRFYSAGERPVTLLFTTLLATLFAIIPMLTQDHRSTRSAGPSITLTLLPLLNAGGFFLALYGMFREEKDTLAWFALVLTAAYLGISVLLRMRFEDDDAKFIQLLHATIAVAFVTIASPLKLDGPWITIGWLVESAALLAISVRTKTDFVRYLAAAALMLGIFRLLFFDNFQTDTLLFNARFATYLIAIAILGGIVKFGAAHVTEGEKPLLRLALVLLNLLALIALTREASNYFDRQSGPTYYGNARSAQIQIGRDFSYSAIWLLYGVALMAAGFLRRSAFVRWQSLVLIAATIVKVFLYDVSALDKGYRILSFVALGGVLLGISFIYQRDWLKLSHASEEGAEPTR